MTKGDAEALVKKHGSVTKAARAAGMARSSFRRRLSGDATQAPVARAAAAPNKAGKSIADFRATYDKDFIIPQRIRAGIKALGAAWEYEVAFAKMAGVSLNDLGNYREQFADYVVTLKRDGKRAWAGTASMAKAMRGMVS
jgi:hypothetical protein